MSYPTDKEGAVSEYMNRAARRMYRYFSDMKYDIDKIRELEPNESVYFIVCPSNTHSSYKTNLEYKRKEIRQVWGNHIVIEVRRNDNNQYYVENFDRDLTHRWSNDTPQYIIDAFNDFVLESEN